MRHPSLQNLSREHQETLTQVRSLRWAAQGIGDMRGSCLDFFHYWMEKGDAHFLAEEQCLLAFCRKSSNWKESSSSQYFEKVHAKVRESMEYLRTHLASDSEMRAGILQLADLLEAVVQHEDKVFFDEIERTLTREELNELQKQLEKR